MISIKSIQGLPNKQIRYMTTFNQRTLKSIAVPQTRQYKNDKLPDRKEILNKILKIVDQENDEKELSIIEDAKEKIEIKLDDNQVTPTEI